jgi:hypothetical protein
MELRQGFPDPKEKFQTKARLLIIRTLLDLQPWIGYDLI